MNDLKEVIERYVDHAIERNDTKAAIQFNWLLNAVEQGQIDVDAAFSFALLIHAQGY